MHKNFGQEQQQIVRWSFNVGVLSNCFDLSLYIPSPAGVALILINKKATEIIEVHTSLKVCKLTVDVHAKRTDQRHWVTGEN